MGIKKLSGKNEEEIKQKNDALEKVRGGLSCLPHLVCECKCNNSCGLRTGMDKALNNSNEEFWE